jgi:hypothetical protein
MMDLARALDIDLARDRASDLARDLDFAFTCDLDRDLALDLALDWTLSLALVRDRDRDRDRAFARDRGLDLKLAGVLDLNRARALAVARDRALDRARDLACGHNDDLYEALVGLKSPAWDAPADAGRMFVHELREVMARCRDIGHDWKFSEEQAERLAEYSEANRLLLECLKVAYVSDRGAIEDSLLLPPGKWKPWV